MAVIDPPLERVKYILNRTVQILVDLAAIILAEMIHL